MSYESESEKWKIDVFCTMQMYCKLRKRNYIHTGCIRTYPTNLIPPVIPHFIWSVKC